MSARMLLKIYADILNKIVMAHRAYSIYDLELPTLKLRLNAKFLFTATISIKNNFVVLGFDWLNIVMTG